MGDTINKCYTHPQNQEFVNEVVVVDKKKDQFQQILKQFIENHQSIKRYLPKAWNYCTHINRSIITRYDQDIFVGALEPVDQIHQAIVLYNDGLIYEGQVKQYKRQGLGKLISSEGDCYEGNWKENQPHDQGVYEGGSPRRKYQGLWQRGQLQGKGMAIYEDGSVYQGQFHKNMRHGKGKIRYPDSSVYEGEFENDQINGYGVLVGINHKYEGQWKNGKMNGKGQSQWYNDQNQLIQSYHGSYKNGLKHGLGEYRWSNGKKYSGQWSEGQVKKMESK